MQPKINLQQGQSILLFLLIISLIGGDSFLSFNFMGISLYGFRIVISLGAVYLIFTKSFMFYNSKYSKFVFFSLLFWIVYGGVLLFWSEDKSLALKEMFYLSVGFLFYLILYNLKRNLHNFYELLERYWIIGFLCLSLFLTFEFFTQHHFRGSHFDNLLSLGYFHQANEVPVFTFGNQNHLAIYLCFTILLSVYFIIKGYKFIVHSLVILLSINFLLFSASRFSYLFLIAILLLILILTAFKFVRNTSSFKFEWKKILIVGLIALINFGVVYSKYYKPSQVPIETEVELPEEKTPEEKDVHVAESSAQNQISEIIDKSLTVVTHANTLIVAIDSNEIKEFKKDGTDFVFLIDSKLNSKLLNGEFAKVQIKKFSIKNIDSTQFFRDKTINLWLTILLFTCLALVIALLLTSSNFNAFYITSLISAFVLLSIGVFCFHSFDRPNKGFSESVLTEVSTSAKDIKDVSITSIDANCANALIKGVKLNVGYNTTEYAAPTDKKSNLPTSVTVHEEALSGNRIRINLILNGLDYLKKSNYLGIGPAGNIIHNQLKKGKYPIGTVESPHNFIIEILSQYGVIVALLLFVLCFLPFILIGKSFFKKVWSNEHTFLLMLFICLILLGNANSRFLSLPINWCILSFIFVVSGELFTQHKKRIND